MRFLIVRRVIGESMVPALLPGQFIVAVSVHGSLRAGQVVIVRHEEIEKIKRIAKVDAERQKLYVVGDNPAHSTDSRHFGWLPIGTVVAVVLWPRLKR